MARGGLSFESFGRGPVLVFAKLAAGGDAKGALWGTFHRSEVACYERIRNNSGCCRRRIFGRSAILLRPILGRGVVDAAPNGPFIWVALNISSNNAGAGIVSDNVLAKLVVTVIVLMAFTMWLQSEGHQSPACDVNCPTDFSANRR